MLADGALRQWIGFTGSPLVAMLLAAVLALYTFGTACGFDRERLLRFADESIPAVAGVLLVVGAGGGFGRVLDAAGVDTAIAQSMSGLRLSPLVLGWVFAALLRVSVGSATVACVTAASIMTPIVAAMPGANKELLVVAIGAGSLIASHVNDGGFWLVKEYFGMSVPADRCDLDGARDDRLDARAGGVLLLAAAGGSGPIRLTADDVSLAVELLAS